MALAYLGTPYSRYPSGLEMAYIEACRIGGALLKTGVSVYSPIAHTHGLALYGAIDALDHSIWLPFDELMMARCDTLIVAHMEGWDTSKGIAHEVAYFEKAGKPIFDLDPQTLKMVRRRQDKELDHAAVVPNERPDSVNVRPSK